MKGSFRGKRRSRKAAQKRRACIRHVYAKRRKYARLTLDKLNKALWEGDGNVETFTGFATVITQNGRPVNFAEDVVLHVQPLEAIFTKLGALSSSMILFETPAEARNR